MTKSTPPTSPSSCASSTTTTRLCASSMQRYEIRGDLAQIDGARRGQVVFYRESELPPGVYSMETVVHDALANKASVRLSTVEVPRHDERRLRASSLLLVPARRGSAGESAPRHQPPLVNGVALQPNLARTVRRDAEEARPRLRVTPLPDPTLDVVIQPAKRQADCGDADGGGCGRGVRADSTARTVAAPRADTGQLRAAGNRDSGRRAAPAARRW